jgi:hypothetical protein
MVLWQAEGRRSLGLGWVKRLNHHLGIQVEEPKSSDAVGVEQYAAQITGILSRQRSYVGNHEDP